MTLEVGTVNLLIETRGGTQKQGGAGAAWVSPLASITIRNLLLYNTNENWEVLNLKEARYFSNNKKCIYVFKKLEWASLSIDLLPHPDMFTDANLTCSSNGGNKRNDDGAKRVFFGGESFLEGISGQAYITVQRTELNSPLGLEVQLHFPEAVCPALSEPGLRAVLRFMTGLYVCINRDVDPNAQQATEAAGRSLVSIVVDHIFLCIKDADFQLELLMQSLFFSRAGVSDGASTKTLSKITVAGLFLRDTFSHPPCTLIQPSTQAVPEDALHVPDFGKNFCPPIYPLGNMRWQVNEGVPVICLYSLQMKPSPAPPSFTSQTVIYCQPLMIHLQEESCLRIASFLADGIVVNPGDVLPDFSVNSLVFGLKEIDLTVPLDVGKLDNDDALGSNTFRSSFAGARLHVKDLFFSESPELKLRLLNLDKDPACFCLWEDQPVDASQLKWTARASQLSLSLETGTENQFFSDSSMGLWKCVELLEVCVEAAMVTADGSPLITVPPPGGIVRIGVSCLQYLSNTSVEQLFFVLDLYSYFGRVAEKISKIGKGNRDNGSIKKSLGGKLIEKFPSDTAVILAMQDLQLRFLESSSSINIEGMPLVLFNGDDLFIKVSHRTLGGAIAVSSNIRWESIQVDCVDGDGNLVHKNGIVGISSEDGLLVNGNGYPHMRTVFWIDNTGRNLPTGITSPIPFLDISMVQVIPYNAHDTECHRLSMSAKVGGVRLGGGMNYTEALLHRFGILGPDGGPSEGLSKGLKYLSNGPLSKLLRASPTIEDEEQESGSSDDEEGGPSLELGIMPDDVDVSVELKNWLFALEGAQERAERWWFHDEDIGREDRCWHTMFQSLLVKAKSHPKNVENVPITSPLSQKYPVELVTVGVEGLQAIKPQTKKEITADGISSRVNKGTGNCGGVNFEVRMVSSESIESTEMPTWGLENVKFSIKQPIEAVATKEELEYLVGLCKSEVDSMGRIAAGILRLLKLDGSIGQAAIDQLSNLGSDGLEKIFSPEKLSRRSSTCSMGFTPITPTSNISESQHPSLESTVALLESAVSDSQSKCLGLMSELDNSDCIKQQDLNEIRQLQQKLESMHLLLSRLRTQI